MTCLGAGQPMIQGRCPACDRFAPVGLAEGAPMPAHTRARVMTDDELLMALLPRHPWEGAQERAIQQAVTDLLQPKGETDGDDA